MVDWRTARILYLLPLLMFGVVLVAVWSSYGNQLTAGVAFIAQLLPESSPATSPVPGRVGGAMSAPAPKANPVLQIRLPEHSIFAP